MATRSKLTPKRKSFVRRVPECTEKEVRTIKKLVEKAFLDEYGIRMNLVWTKAMETREILLTGKQAKVTHNGKMVVIQP